MIDQSPLGAPTDPPFNDADLLDVAREFALQPGAAYFGAENQTVICIPDIHDPFRQQICSTKASGEPWIDPIGGWSTVVVVPPVNPPVATPEPHYLAVSGVMFLVGVALIRFGWRRK